jgi:hypothetical protein
MKKFNPLLPILSLRAPSAKPDDQSSGGGGGGIQETLKTYILESIVDPAIQALKDHDFPSLASHWDVS